MKMLPEHFEHLKLHVNAEQFAYPNLRQVYESRGLSRTRFQWDMVNSAGLMPWICDVLYKYLDDAHIQTALNKIIPK